MTYSSNLRRFTGALTTVALGVLALASCASGQRPETGGVELGTYLARFSGQWTLDRTASEDPARALEAHGQERRSRGHAAGHGRRGGRHGAGGHGGGGQGGLDPAILEATFDAFRAVPDRFSLAVTESLVVTTWASERAARLPVAGDAIPIHVRGPGISVRARWDRGRLRIERRIDGGGTIVDLVEALPEGNRLLVTRTVQGVPGTVPDITLAFDRADRGEGPSPSR